MNSLRKSALVILSGKSLRLVIGVIFTPILVRLLSQENYGVYAHLMAVIGVLIIVAPLGLFDSVRKHIAEHRDDTGKESNILVASLVLCICYSIAVALGFVSVNRIVELVSPKFIPLLILIIFLNNIFQVLRGVYYGRRREQIAEIFVSLRKATYVGIALILVYLGSSVFGVITAYTAALVLVTVAISATVVPTLNCQHSLLNTVRTNEMSLVGRYGVTQAIGGVSAMLLYKTDILLVEYFRASTETALYQAALLPAEYIWFIPSAIQMALLQNASYHWSQGNFERLNDNLSQGLKYAIAALILCGVGLYVLSDYFVLFYYGSEYGASSYSLQILLVGTFFFGISRVFFPVLQATGWLRYTESLTVITLVVNIALNLFLIPRYGIEGAAIATSISYVFLFVGGLFLLARSEFMFLGQDALLRLSVLLVVFAASFLSLTRLFDPSPLITLIVFPMLGFVVFAIAAMVLGVIRIDEVRDLLSTTGVLPL
jgi:O-antigen/teichoic acid export membrane protein